MSSATNNQFVSAEPRISFGAQETEQLGEQFGQTLSPGDLVVLTGPLGSGKTTFTRGLARGVGIVEPVTSPTYAIAFVHEHPGSGPDLVHVDAYRLTGLDDLETIDLEPLLDSSITVMEWGSDFVASLADSWYEIIFDRDLDDEDARKIAIFHKSSSV
ncbi:MAG: tRNA (adenosine(37)-N6)-threonylcarbamoyltransferase complex ATPase subunit type 1 TsaE [Candidatus Nanopelagicales bacterium]